MQCEATGKILQALSPIMGTLKNGNDWEKREYIIETSTWYHTKMKFAMYSFDGPIENAPQVGDNVKVNFVVEARENKGAYYNEVKATHIEKL